jgi:hypothetical protein
MPVDSGRVFDGFGGNLRQLIEERQRLQEIKDIEDSGLGGKKFEQVFVKALRLAGMKFKENVVSGPGWDIHTQGEEWLKLIADKNVNIKVHGTKWMLSSSELYKSLPWDKLPEDYDPEKYIKKVRSVFSKKGVAQIYFLKPRSAEIQQEIGDAVSKKDVEKIKELLVKKNFLFEKLGQGYGVRILDNGERITSIAITKGGKVFMRSEKPRKMGGSVTVTFRAPTPKISKTNRKVARI